MPSGVIRREREGKHANPDASVTPAPPSPIVAAVRKSERHRIETTPFQYSQESKTRKPSAIGQEAISNQELSTTPRLVIQKLEDVSKEYKEERDQRETAHRNELEKREGAHGEELKRRGIEYAKELDKREMRYT
jgi:hypothetical protein